MTASDRFFVISGCSGGGKSTLIDALAAAGYAVVPEAGRQIVAAIEGVAQPGTDLFGHLLLSRAMHQYNTALATTQDRVDGAPVFFDRSVIEPVNGWRHGGVTDAYVAKAAARFRYAETVFVAPPWPEIFEADAERRHDLAAGEHEYEQLLVTFADLGYRAVELPKVGVAERVEFVEATLATLF